MFVEVSEVLYAGFSGRILLNSSFVLHHKFSSWRSCWLDVGLEFQLEKDINNVQKKSTDKTVRLER